MLQELRGSLPLLQSVSPLPAPLPAPIPPLECHLLRSPHLLRNRQPFPGRTRPNPSLHQQSARPSRLPLNIPSDEGAYVRNERHRSYPHRPLNPARPTTPLRPKTQQSLLPWSIPLGIRLIVSTGLSFLNDLTSEHYRIRMVLPHLVLLRPRKAG